MYREIKNNLYRITYHSGVRTHVECETEYDLMRYVAGRVAEGCTISSVNKIKTDGTTPRVAVLSDKTYKNLYHKYRNVEYAKRKCAEYCKTIEMYSDFDGRIYVSRDSGAFATIGACDDPRLGAVCINGRVELIDEWLDRLV